MSAATIVTASGSSGCAACAVSLTAPVFLVAGWKKQNVSEEERFLRACAPGIFPPSFEEESNAPQQLRLADASEPAPAPASELGPGPAKPEPEPEPELQVRGVW
jgi:hypothetical protein